MPLLASNSGVSRRVRDIVSNSPDHGCRDCPHLWSQALWSGAFSGDLMAKKAGRPSRYKEAYCNEVVSFMAQGYSLTAFAGEIGVARSTINEWMEHYPDFSEAVKVAKAKCARWWEDRNRKNAEEGGGNATAAIFGLKNMAPDDWREKTEHELTGKDGGAIKTEATLDASKLDNDTLAKIMAAKDNGAEG